MPPPGPHLAVGLEAESGARAAPGGANGGMYAPPPPGPHLAVGLEAESGARAAPGGQGGGSEAHVAHGRSVPAALVGNGGGGEQPTAVGESLGQEGQAAISRLTMRELLASIPKQVAWDWAKGLVSQKEWELETDRQSGYPMWKHRINGISSPIPPVSLVLLRADVDSLRMAAEEASFGKRAIEHGGGASIGGVFQSEGEGGAKKTKSVARWWHRLLFWRGGDTDDDDVDMKPSKRQRGSEDGEQSQR
jgi:hypothetical protein